MQQPNVRNASNISLISVCFLALLYSLPTSVTAEWPEGLLGGGNTRGDVMDNRPEIHHAGRNGPGCCYG